MTFRTETIGDCTLILGDCLEVMPTLGRFDAVVTDPPYGKVKGDFDHAWTNRQSMLASADLWAEAMAQRIKFNGSLWWFAWPSLAGRIETLIACRMNVLSHIVWKKPTATGLKARKESLRAPMPVTERIIFAEHFGADNAALGESGYIQKCDELRGFVFEPLRKYLADEWARAGLTKKDANEATGTQMAAHWFTTSQWALPTRDLYETLRARANCLGGDFLRREYDDLRREYDDLRRYFDCRAGDQFFDVWEFGTDAQRHGHPTQKPVDLMQYIVRLSVRPNGEALDPFMGSGTTGVACVNLGRKFTGIELDPGYFDIACKRIEEAYKQPRLFEEPRPKPVQETINFDEDAA